MLQRGLGVEACSRNGAEFLSNVLHWAEIVKELVPACAEGGQSALIPCQGVVVQLATTASIHRDSSVRDDECAFHRRKRVLARNAEKVTTSNTNLLDTLRKPVVFCKERLLEIVVGIKKGGCDENVLAVLILIGET